MYDILTTPGGLTVHNCEIDNPYADKTLRRTLQVAVNLPAKKKAQAIRNCLEVELAHYGQIGHYVAPNGLARGIGYLNKIVVAFSRADKYNLVLDEILYKYALMRTGEEPVDFTNQEAMTAAIWDVNSSPQGRISFDGNEIIFSMIHMWIHGHIIHRKLSTAICPWELKNEDRKRLISMDDKYSDWRRCTETGQKHRIAKPDGFRHGLLVGEDDWFLAGSHECVVVQDFVQHQIVLVGPTECHHNLV